MSAPHTTPSPQPGAAVVPPHDQASCELCGLAVGRAPVARRIEQQDHVYCCAGCANVYAILLESGVLAGGQDFRETDLYRESKRLGLISNPEIERTAVPGDAESREAVYHLGGLWCTACGWLIEHALSREPGVVSAEVLFTSDLLKVRYCPQYVEAGRIQQRVSSLGYRATEYTGEQEHSDTERRDLLLRLGVAAFLWANVMMFSLVIYASYFEGVSESARRGVPFVLMALATPAVFYSAWPILRLGFLGLREGAVRMEALISTGVLAAYLYSAMQAVIGGQHYYFDTACAIVTLVLVGKAMERGAKERTAKSLSLLHRLMPTKARLTAIDHERFVSIDAVQPGMELLVKPGERIPADGVVTSGNSTVDEALLSGESNPLPKTAGDEVVGGSLNGAGVLQVKVTRTGDGSTLAQIIRAVESAMASRTPVERTVDKVSRVFVPVVILVAVATLLGFTLAGAGFGEALMRAIAVLVIACPCALGIATPLATTAAIGEASRRGILIRDAQVLETVQSVDVLILDKTGTATEGRLRVREDALADRETLRLLASLEAYSEHPLAQALVRHARDRSLEFAEATDIKLYEGLGIAGLVEGKRVLAGSKRLLERERLVVPGAVEAQAANWRDEGFTVIYAAVDGAVAGALALGDQIRPEAPAVVHQLHHSRVRTVLLSGDAATTTRRIAARLGVQESRGEVAPSAKAEAVRDFQTGGSVVAMVGDGVNDAPALAAANLGIALGTGTDLAINAAPVVLMHPSLERLIDIFAIARLTGRVVRQNLFWAFFYNTVGISLAIAGILNPILAAGAMVLSSLSVIGNSMRLSRRR